MTSMRLPPSTSLIRRTERSCPTASGVSVSGNVTASLSGSTGSADGRDSAPVPSGPTCGKLDRHSGIPGPPGPWPRPPSIGTRRTASSWRTSGMSMRRMPSS